MKNFFDSKDEKITEKVFMQSIIVSFVSILLCIVLLCSLTYAWFSEGLQSSSNNITAGHFSIKDVSVESVDSSTKNKQAISPNASGVYELTEGTYKITLKTTPETTSRGYCVITINDKVYKTDVIVNEKTKNKIYNVAHDPFVFRITITEQSATLKIESRWGIPADSNVRYDGIIVIPEASSNQ